jgi:hypothetical protein
MNTENIIQTVKSRYDYRLNKNLLEEKYKSKLLIVNQGGYWIASQQFISFLAVKELPKEINLLDEYKNVVLVDRKTLLTALIETYTTVMKEWGAELELLKQKR